jgi:hypothetical protein
MSLLGDIQAANIGWAHRLNHTDQDETSQMFLMKRGAANELVEGKQIESFEYCDRTIEGQYLPEGVGYELRIAEEVLSDSDLKRNMGLKHGDRFFRVLQPSPFPPSGAYRFWRFWIAGVEKL